MKVQGLVLRKNFTVELNHSLTSLFAVMLIRLDLTNPKTKMAVTVLRYD